MAFTYRTFTAPLKVKHIISNFWLFESDEGIGAYTHFATATVFPKIVFGLEGCFSISSNDGSQTKLNRYSLSLRQFERKFKKITGFSPKHFHRISRFEKATDTCRQANLKMTDIAYRFGYFDQAHFTKDFKQFSGFTPLAYQNVASLDIVFTNS